LRDHENVCGSKTETCSICRSQVMIKELEDHTLSCSMNESRKDKTRELKLKEDKIKRDKEIETRKRQEETLKIEEEMKRKKDKEKMDEIKRKDDEKKREEKKKEEEKKRIEEEKKSIIKQKNEVKIVNPSTSKIQTNTHVPSINNKIQTNTVKDKPIVDINKNTYIKDNEVIKENIVKNPIKENEKKVYTKPKPESHYIDKTFKDPKQIQINKPVVTNDNANIGFKYSKKVPSTENKVGTESKVVPNKTQPSQVKGPSHNTKLDHSMNNYYPDINDYNDDELIRKLQLQEDEKLAREMMDEKQYVNLKSDEELAKRFQNEVKINNDGDEELAKKLQEEFYGTANNFN